MFQKLQANIPRLIVILIGALVLLQARAIHKSYGLRYFRVIKTYRSESALERSAIISGGIEFADYMDFLRKTIPEDSKVILPPREPVQALANIGYMQYFLMPREILNCGISEVEECVLRMTGDKSYIITAWKFPPHETALEVKRFIPFTEGKGGVYAPK